MVDSWGHPVHRGGEGRPLNYHVSLPPRQSLWCTCPVWCTCPAGEEGDDTPLCDARLPSRLIVLLEVYVNFICKVFPSQEKGTVGSDVLRVFRDQRCPRDLQGTNVPGTFFRLLVRGVLSRPCNVLRCFFLLRGLLRFRRLYL